MEHIKLTAGHGRTVLKALVLVLLAMLVFRAVSASLDRVNASQDMEGQRLLEDSLRRATVSCYASEGFYPPTLRYLVEHYGIVIDEDRYAVYYDIFADNIMPEITVVPLSTEGGGPA